MDNSSFLPPISTNHKRFIYTPAKSKPGEDVMKFFNKKTYNLNPPAQNDLKNS